MAGTFLLESFEAQAASLTSLGAVPERAALRCAKSPRGF